MSKKNLCAVILALSIAIGFAATAHAQKRVALLVGNNAYQNVPRLQTAVNDARAVGTALRGLGFSVILAENQSRRAMSEALLAFDKAIEPGDIALFFFAGHGFEIRGQNYLLPTDIPEVREGQEELIRDSAFPADRIIDRLQGRGARTAVLVLDACRNNPFERPGGRGLKGSGGLAVMTLPRAFHLFSLAPADALDRCPPPSALRSPCFTETSSAGGGAGLTLLPIAKRFKLILSGGERRSTKRRPIDQFSSRSYSTQSYARRRRPAPPQTRPALRRDNAPPMRAAPRDPRAELERWRREERSELAATDNVMRRRATQPGLRWRTIRDRELTPLASRRVRSIGCG